MAYFVYSVFNIYKFFREVEARFKVFSSKPVKYALYGTFISIFPVFSTNFEYRFNIYYQIYWNKDDYGT